MPQPTRLRQAVACLPCREKKVRCDGHRPCAYCKKHDWECSFPSRSRKRGKTSTVAASSASLQPGTTPLNENNASTLYQEQASRLTPTTATAPLTWKQPMQAPITVDSTRSYSPCDQERGITEQNATLEYHGAGSMLSVFSKLGSQWVFQQTGASEFESMAKSLASEIVSWLKLTQSIPEERAAEPERATALELTSAYFEDNETSFGILHQPSFELRLRQFFDLPNASSADPGWYALRNTVYAGGKRKILKDAGVVDFKEVHSSAFPYFANALAVHTEMIYYKSSMTAVQALAAMAHFTEAIGAPFLEYTLQSNAIRLAQSKALHRKVPPTLGLSQFEVQQRSLLFWSMYVHEKHIAYWSGRPSAIDDDCITCPLPRTTGFGDENRVAYLIHLIRLTQILSAVLKFLSRLETRGMVPDKIFRSMQHLNAQLRMWTESAPPACRPTALRRSSLPSNVPANLILYIRYTYYGAVIALNSCFTYPWLTERVNYREDARFQKQVDESTDLVAETSRDAIKDTKHIDIDFSSPAWLVFYYPLVGLIHVFIHIIKSPSAPTVQYDLALLEDICGHFARLKYTTSSALSFPFLKELCRFAEHIVNDCNHAMNDPGTSLDGTRQPGSGTQRNLAEGDGGGSSNNLTDFSEVLDFGFLDTNLSFEPLYPPYGDDVLL